ncbi:MAG TPA: CmcJ/NvfI family oxidoreductase [Myxococcota bacterium]|nr:CmcJ/NvfI family oxidoreductase [Myxococcota bacterium]
MSLDLPLSDLPATEGVLHYLAPSSEKLVSYTFKPPAGVPSRPRTEPHTVPIRDARKLVHAAELDREGFALVSHATRVRDFLDPAQITGIYYPDLESLLRTATGAEKVVIFDYTLRSAADARERGVREPVRFVHNDYTVKSGPRLVGDHLPALEAERRRHGRHAVVNVWRPIRNPVVATPLAVCDARTIRGEDWAATDLVYPGRVGEVYSVRFNPAHRWFYYSGLRRDEALLIKTYDSLEDGTARFSAHSAFDDPATPAGAPPRESIEVRALLLYPGG